MLLLAGILDEWLQRLPSLRWGGRAMGLPPSWHGCWSSSWIAPLGSISEQVERRRRSHTSHRPDPAAAEDKVKESVTAPITLNTLYSGSQWPYITSVWSWLDNGSCTFLCVHISRSPKQAWVRVQALQSRMYLCRKNSTNTQCLGIRCGLTYMVLWPACSAVSCPCLYTCTDIKE